MGMKAQEDPSRLDLTVTDLKQWAYCRRIPFYRYVQPVDTVRTYRMQRGRAAQAAVEALERRRRLREYGLAAGQRLFDVWLRSERLGLSGRIDLLVLTTKACMPVDFKDTEGGVRKNHRMQLAAYALLAEESFHRPAPAAFVYLVPTHTVVQVDLSCDDRTAAEVALRELRQMVASELLPPPTALRTRCTACEYRNYCADIW
jgi:CRISPR-associated exonuclease Cas4